MGAAIEKLSAIGMHNVAAHEAELTEYALRRLKAIPDIQIFGDNLPSQAADRLGVIPFKVGNLSHFKVAAILGYEFGIGVRSGCFCAHPYILHLLGLSEDEARQVHLRMLAGDRSDMPGLIRASFGLYNTLEDVDALLEALAYIVKGEYQGNYVQDRASGEYKPTGWSPDFERHFSIRVNP
jgi:selenocysteine lyase/cysteine desulfurase